jgi:hypothetical protein
MFSEIVDFGGNSTSVNFFVFFEFVLIAAAIWMQFNKLLKIYLKKLKSQCFLRKGLHQYICEHVVNNLVTVFNIKYGGKCLKIDKLYLALKEIIEIVKNVGTQKGTYHATLSPKMSRSLLRKSKAARSTWVIPLSVIENNNKCSGMFRKVKYKSYKYKTLIFGYRKVDYYSIRIISLINRTKKVIIYLIRYVKHISFGLVVKVGFHQSNEYLSVFQERVIFDLIFGLNIDLELNFSLNVQIPNFYLCPLPFILSKKFSSVILVKGGKDGKLARMENIDRIAWFYCEQDTKYTKYLCQSSLYISRSIYKSYFVRVGKYLKYIRFIKCSDDKQKYYKSNRVILCNILGNCGELNTRYNLRGIIWELHLLWFLPQQKSFYIIFMYYHCKEIKLVWTRMSANLTPWAGTITSILFLILFFWMKVLVMCNCILKMFSIDKGNQQLNF